MFKFQAVSTKCHLASISSPKFENWKLSFNLNKSSVITIFYVIHYNLYDKIDSGLFHH